MKRLALLATSFFLLAAAAANADQVTASLTSGDFPFRTSTAVDGVLSTDTGAPISGGFVLLEASPYPYSRFTEIAHTASATDGSFSFDDLVPDRDTQYRVVEAASAATTSQVLTATVEAPGVTALYKQPYGQVLVTALSYHSKHFNWNNKRAYWFVATRGSFHWHRVAVTHTREVHPGVTYMSATFTPPLGHFDFRVCFNAPGETSYGAPGTHGPCPHGDFNDRVAAP